MTFVIKYRDEDGTWWVEHVQQLGAGACCSSSNGRDAMVFLTHGLAQKIADRLNERVDQHSGIRTPYRVANRA